MKFSIILPVYKVEKYIEKCILSCLEQKEILISDYEIIIVNDGSPDNSIRLAKDICALYPKHNIKFIDRPNGGLSAARNTGMDNAIGEYIWFIDSDDFIEENSLKILADIIKINNRIEIIHFLHKTIFKEKDQIVDFPLKEGEYTGIKILKSTHFLSACTNIYQNRFLKKYGLRFSEGVIFEDSEFNIRAYGICASVYCINDVLYNYIRRDGSITSQKASYKSLNSGLLNIESIQNFFSTRTISPEDIHIINTQLSYIYFAIIAGLKEVSPNDYLKINDTLKKKHLSYVHIYKNLSLGVVKIAMWCAIYMQPLFEYILAYKMKFAIKKSKSIH